MVRIISHSEITFSLIGHSLWCKSHSSDSFFRVDRLLFVLCSQNCADGTTVSYLWDIFLPQEETLYPWQSLPVLKLRSCRQH